MLASKLRARGENATGHLSSNRHFRAQRRGSGFLHVRKNSVFQSEMGLVSRQQGHSVAAELRRFAIVGAINTFLDLAVLNALIAITGLGRTGVWYTAFKAISFFIAVVNSYFMHHGWTFKRRSGQRGAAQAGQFLMVSLFGAFLNVTSASYVATFIPPVHALDKYWPSLAALVGTACGLASNFVGYRHIVFCPRQPREADASYD
jgi:putative flippase GtrA